MALELIATDGSETGATSAAKINAVIEQLNNKTPKGAFSQLAPTVYNLDDTDYTIADFDVLVVSRGGITADLVTNKITIAEAGVVNASFGVDCDFAQQEELVITFFINDLEMPTTPFSLQGIGDGKPNAISWTTSVPVEAGDTIDMRFKNGDIGPFNANIRRMFLSVEADN